MTIDLTQYDLQKWMALVDERIKRVEKNAPRVSIPGFQMLPNGTPWAQNGLAVGAGKQTIAEPTEVPVPTGLELSWGSSFDTVFIDVSWSAPAGYGADQVVSYLVQATKFGGLGVPIESTTKSTTIRIEPVEPDSTYTVQVSAITRTGRPSSVATDTILVGGDTTAPAAPTFPAGAVAEGIEALSVKWNPNTERDVANGKGWYRVRVSTHSDLSSPAFDAKISGTTAWVGNLTAGEDYYVGVNAVDSSGNQSPLGTPSGGPWTPAANVTDMSAFAFGGGNVIRDSGFESSTPGERWLYNPANISVDSSVSHGGFGGHSLRMTGTGDETSSQDMTVSKGTWILSGWVKASSVVSVSGSPYGVIIYAETLSGTTSGHHALLGTMVGGGIASAGLGTFDWQRIAIRFDVTTATALLRIHCQRGGLGTVSGTAWFDEIQLENGDSLTGYAPRPDEILANTIQATMIADNQITTPKLAAGSVVAGKIAADAIGANEIQAASITAAEVAASTITSTQIAANTITAADIAANTITAAEIAADSITTSELAADSVTAAELAAVAIAVGKFIQSVGYVSNAAGWHIDGNGNAEFNNATFRGTINAARLGSDVFDFMRPGGMIAARFHFTGSENRFYLGEGMVNAAQYMYYDTVVNRMVFKGGLANNPAWEFTQRAQFSSGAYAPGGYATGQWGSGSGFHVAASAAGVQDTNWGVGFGWDGASGYTAMLQGYLDSTSRHVGLANMNGAVQQVFIDGGSGAPSDTRSLTRTGWIVYSDPKFKSGIKALSKSGSARDKINAIEPIRYKLRTKVGKRIRLSTREHLGFSAEAMKDIVPEAVHDDVCFVDPKNATADDIGLGLQETALIPVLWQGHREQDVEIATLQERVLALEEKLRG